MTSSGTMQVHPVQRLATPGGDEADIDAGMVRLVSAVWSLGLKTTACCQDFGEGTQGQREAVPHEPTYGGDAFVAYYRGYAWLRMPQSDARLLCNLLLGTDFRGQITKRWSPGSWRLHVPMVYNGIDSIRVADDADIYYPAGQTQLLTAAVNDLKNF